MTKSKITDQLDELFNELLKAASSSNAGEISYEQKLDLFKEGVRYAAVKNKIPEDDERTPKNDRLTKFKHGLGRG